MSPPTSANAARHILTLTCTDRPGIVHAVAAGLLDIGGNIVENAQFTDTETDTFCMRLEVDAPTAQPDDVRTAVQARLNGIVGHSDLTVRRAERRPRVLILVSKYDHCLIDLLYRWRNDLLAIDIVSVASNHRDLEGLVQGYGLPFVYLPVTPSTKANQEAALMDIVDDEGIDLVVLARYMQVLSTEVCRAWRGKAINIHHSFLPGFKGAKPYHQAFDRGVKLVGATAHFVTADLDEGPIIEQDVVRVSHAVAVGQLVELGQDVERLVLSKAVRYFAEDRLFLVGSKTVVFP